MRTWGRVKNDDGTYGPWQEVSTSPTGDDSRVWITSLCQALLLNIGESPFYANYGLPSKPTIVQQVQPDFYVMQTQRQYAQYFANLIVAKTGSNPPSYRINALTLQGDKFPVTLTFPQ